MKTEITHTATPWTVVGYTEAGYDDGLDGAVGNARHIVRCVNSYDALVALAEKVANLNPDVEEIGAGMLKQLVASARAAIAQK